MWLFSETPWNLWHWFICNFSLAFDCTTKWNDRTTKICNEWFRRAMTVRSKKAVNVCFALFAWRDRRWGHPSHRMLHWVGASRCLTVTYAVIYEKSGERRQNAKHLMECGKLWIDFALRIISTEKPYTHFQHNGHDQLCWIWSIGVFEVVGSPGRSSSSTLRITQLYGANHRTRIECSNCSH